MSNSFIFSNILIHQYSVWCKKFLITFPTKAQNSDKNIVQRSLKNFSETAILFQELRF